MTHSAPPCAKRAKISPIYICAEVFSTSVLAPMASMSTPMETSLLVAVVLAVTTIHWDSRSQTTCMTSSLSKLSVLCATVISLTQTPLMLKGRPARKPKETKDMLSTTFQIHLSLSLPRTESKNVPLSFTTVMITDVAALDQESAVVTLDQGTKLWSHKKKAVSTQPIGLQWSEGDE